MKNENKSLVELLQLLLDKFQNCCWYQGKGLCFVIKEMKFEGDIDCYEAGRLITFLDNNSTRKARKNVGSFDRTARYGVYVTYVGYYFWSPHRHRVRVRFLKKHIKRLGYVRD